MSDDKEKNVFPEHFREISIGGLNYSVCMRSTFENENLNFLINQSILIIDYLEKRKVDNDEMEK